MMNVPDIPKINEGIARKFRKIEARFALRRSAVELFEALLADIQTEFSIPFVWLSLIRIPEMTGLQKSLEASPLLRDRLNIIENLKNKFKVTTLVELVKNILKIIPTEPYFRVYNLILNQRTNFGIEKIFSGD